MELQKKAIERKQVVQCTKQYNIRNETVVISNYTPGIDSLLSCYQLRTNQLYTKKKKILSIKL